MSGRRLAVWPGRPSPLGATWDGSGTNFAIFSEGAERVELCLFDDDVETRITLPESTAFVHHCYLPEVGPGQYYAYRVHGAWDPHNGRRHNPAKFAPLPTIRHNHNTPPPVEVSHPFPHRLCPLQLRFKLFSSLHTIWRQNNPHIPAPWYHPSHRLLGRRIHTPKPRRQLPNGQRPHPFFHTHFPGPEAPGTHQGGRHNHHQ